VSALARLGWGHARAVKTHTAFARACRAVPCRVQRVWFNKPIHGVVAHQYDPRSVELRSGKWWILPLYEANCSWQVVLDWQSKLYKPRPGGRTYDSQPAHREAPMLEMNFPCSIFHLMTPAQRKLFAQVTRPVVMLAPGGDNWGMMSTQFPNRTVQWGNMEANILGMDCDEARRAPNGTLAWPWCTVAHVQRLLDDPRILALFAAGHTNITHRKLYNLPLSTNAHTMVGRLLRPDEHHLKALGERRPRPRLFVNANSGWGPRNETNALILRKFGVPNTYFPSVHQFYRFMLEAKMCAPGVPAARSLPPALPTARAAAHVPPRPGC
jgi:hypothetical protein